MSDPNDEASPTSRRRRPRYSGKNPRRFEDKYKELNPDQHAETVAKVKASGKTPAGQHIPIMVAEVLEVLKAQPGERALDATLGYGGHAEAILRAVTPGGKLVGLDQDPIEMEKTEKRLRALGFLEDQFVARRTNFAGVTNVLSSIDWMDGVDVMLADLGVSSMQIDDPKRGFSFKHEGPLDMRMNPAKGVSARDLLQRITPGKLAGLLEENADEPHAQHLAQALAGTDQRSTRTLAESIRAALPRSMEPEGVDGSVRRVFQAIRIAVNEEFSALDTFLAQVPFCLRPGGRVAILTFHSGEDRRVKKAFKAGLAEGVYSVISEDITRATAAEIAGNPRASSAKLRWAVRSDQ